MQHLTVSIVLTERKTSLITVFPQIFKKYLTDRKLEKTRTRIKKMLSASPSSVFSHKVHDIKFEKQTRILT